MNPKEATPPTTPPGRSEPPRPARLDAILKVIALLLGLLVAVVVGVVLRNLSRVLLPFAFAFFFSYLLFPIQQRLMTLRIPKAVAILLVLLLVFGVINAAGQILYASVATFTQQLPKYERRLTTMAEETLEKLEIPLEEAKRHVVEFDWRSLLGDRSPAQAIAGTVSSTMGTFLGFLGQSLLVLVLMVFILAGRERTGRKLKEALDPEMARRMGAIYETIQREVQNYLVTKTLISLTVAVLVTATLWIFGVDFPLIWGLLTFALNFIPNIGSIVASIFPILLCFVEYGPGLRSLTVTLLLVLSQVGVAYVLEPRLLGNRMRLSPMFVLLALIFWAYVWGIPGMILAVPITSAIKIAFENVPALRPLAVMMG